jgi:hypothetical protein
MFGEILKMVTQIAARVDETVAQGRQNGASLALLRMELGMETPYGRLPAIEQTLKRIEKRQSDLAADLEAIKVGNTEARGRKQLVRWAWSIVRSGAGAGVVGVIAKKLGLIH